MLEPDAVRHLLDTTRTDTNVKALCQRCHLLHDRPEHRRRIHTDILMRRALGGLFTEPYRR